MPIYEYRCGACGHELEALQKMSDGALRKCPECSKSQLRRMVSAPSFRLKGGGWYETDFKGDKEKKRNLVETASGDSSESAAVSSDSTKDSASKEASAKVAEAKSSDAKGSDAKGSDAKGSDAKGSDAKSSDAKSSDAKGSDAASAASKQLKPPKAGRAAAKKTALKPRAKTSSGR